MDTTIRRRKGLKESGHSHDHHHHESHRRASQGQISCLSWMFLLAMFYFSIVSVNILANNHLPTPKTVANSKPEEFTEERARQHLDNFLKVGSRVAGSHQNDIYAHEYIRKTVESIKASLTTDKKIELDVQRPTGSFFMPHHDEFMSYYSNVTNTVVRISSPRSDGNALLLNCHTDSVSNAPGASDDAIACSVLLEILRAIAVDKKPLLHPLILLFNGAEETILQASHGFITQHKWVDQIKAFINLEAAGAGGKELVFQTGPENPWLTWAWAKHAPYPHGSSVGQDLFQSGIIPSDTDFRIFRDHGGKPGIDLAYTKNGYVYHTIHDTPAMIQPGCAQRAGDNIHGVVKHLVQSTESLLPDPSEYRYGSVVYFDFFGLSMVVIPLWLSSLLNYCAIFSVLVYIGGRMTQPEISGYTSFEYSSKLVKAVAVNILGYTATFLCLAVVAVVLTKSDRFMSWYSHPPLAIGLYFPAGLIGLISVHIQARKIIFKKEDARKLESLFFDATLIMWSSLIFQTRHIGSSHFFTIPTLFAVIGRGFFGKEVFANSSSHPGINRVFLYLALMILSVSLHASKLLILGEFFVTLSGRSGSDLPPDLLIFVLVGLCILSCFSYQVCTVYLVDSLKWFYAVMITILLCSIAVAFSSYGFPFDNDPAGPSNKRFILQHTAREFYGVDGALEKQDSGLFICHLDYAGKTFDIGAESVMKSPIHNCTGPYCNMPVPLPLLKLVRKYQYVPVPPPPASATTDLYPFRVTWEKSSTGLDDNKRDVTYSISIDSPQHMTLVLTPVTNGSLVEWSLQGNPKGRNSKYCKMECYFILYTGGYEHPKLDFWLKFSVDTPKDEAVLRLDVSGHYMPDGLVERVNDQSSELKDVTSKVHDWVAPMSWISIYKSYKM